MSDLIRRQDVLDVLKEVFQEYSMGFKPGEESRGFASAVPKAIQDIPAIYGQEESYNFTEIVERRCVKPREQLPDMEEFKKIMGPAVSWLQKNGCPHERIIIEYDSAELVGGEMAFSVEVPD